LPRRAIPPILIIVTAIGTTLSADGTITLPDEVRKKLNLRPGDRVEFVFDFQRGVRLLPEGRPLNELYGMLGRSTRPVVSVEEMHQALLDRAAEEDERIRAGREE